MTNNQQRRAGAPDHIPIFEGIILNLGDAAAPWDEKSRFCQKNDQIGQDNSPSAYYMTTNRYQCVHNLISKSDIAIAIFRSPFIVRTKGFNSR